MYVCLFGSASYCIPGTWWGAHITHWPLPAVRDYLTRGGRWSTYDVSVSKLSNVSFRARCARMGNSLKIPSPTKFARLGHFPPASKPAALPARCSMYLSFLWWNKPFSAVGNGSLVLFAPFSVAAVNYVGS
jgi:hypothetical protein